MSLPPLARPERIRSGVLRYVGSTGAIGLVWRSLLAIATAVALVPASSSAQTTDELFAGDSVRVDGVLIGRVLRIDGPMARVMSREKPVCRAGLMYGDPPICDPAPPIYRDIDLRRSTVERRMEKGHLNLRTLIGGVVGVAAFGGLGYLIGPEIGFGKVDGCASDDVPANCSADQVVPADVLAARQKRQDQERGVAFFGVIGGTATAILARKLGTGWVRFEPSVPLGAQDPWGLTVRVPGPR